MPLAALPDAVAPSDAALAFAGSVLGVPFAQLLCASEQGLRPHTTWTDGWAGAPPDLAGLAATFGDAPERYDVRALVGEGAVATGCRLGEAGAFLVVEAPAAARDDAWLARVRLAADALAGTLSAELSAGQRLLAEVAGMPGPFPERLVTALRRAADVLGLPAAALVRVVGGVWRPETVWDPGATGLFERAAPLAQTVCRATVQADGPIGLHALEEGDVGAYLGVPVCVGGTVYGTLCFAGPAARAAPFADAERALALALARWAGHALEGRSASEALAERQALVNTLYASAPIGLATVELVEAADAPADIRFLSTNRALAALLGTAPGSADGALAEALDVPLRMRRLWTGACRRAHAGAPASRFEFAPAPGRTCAATIARIAGAERDGERPRFVVVIEDVTAQRAATESLREEQAGVGTLLRHAPAFIATADLDGAVTSLRGQPASEGAATVFDLFPGSLASGAALHRALGGEPAAWTAVVGGRTFHARAEPQRDLAGLRAGLTVVGLDVTAQVAAARAAADLDARSASAAELRRALVANLAHELRTPLAALLGYADLLGDGLRGDDLAEAVAETSAVAGRAGRRVLAAVDDLQELVLLGEERLPSAVAPDQVAAVVREAIDAHRAEAHALGVTVALRSDGAGGPLLIDPRLLGRSARQLVARALLGAATERVDLELTTGGDAVRLTVCADDHAAGADAAAADEAIDRLARAMGGTVRRTAGPSGSETCLELPRRPVRLVDLGEPAAASDPLPPRAAAPDAGASAPDALRLADLLDGTPEAAEHAALTPDADLPELVVAPPPALAEAAPPPAPTGDGATVGRTLDLASLLSPTEMRRRADGDAAV